MVFQSDTTAWYDPSLRDFGLTPCQAVLKPSIIPFMASYPFVTTEKIMLQKQTPGSNHSFRPFALVERIGMTIHADTTRVGVKRLEKSPKVSKSPLKASGTFFIP